MHCVRCGSEATRRDGQTRLGGQRWRCSEYHRRFPTRSTRSFSKHRSGVRIAPVTVVGDEAFYGSFGQQRPMLEAALRALQGTNA
jgi:transposase-like protein